MDHAIDAADEENKTNEARRPPPEGWTIAAAMREFASDPVRGRIWQAAFMRWRVQVEHMGDTSGDIPDEVLNGWSELEHDLRTKLISGDVLLVGFDAKACEPIQPDKQWCAITRLDPVDNSAESSTLRLQDIRILLADASETVSRKAPVPPATKTATTPKGKGVAPATLLAIRAIAAVIHVDGHRPLRAANLAKRAADKAQELGLPGADLLNPDAPSMREIAKAFLEGIEAADRD